MEFWFTAHCTLYSNVLYWQVSGTACTGLVINCIVELWYSVVFCTVLYCTLLYWTLLVDWGVMGWYTLLRTPYLVIEIYSLNCTPYLSLFKRKEQHRAWKMWQQKLSHFSGLRKAIQIFFEMFHICKTLLTIENVLLHTIAKCAISCQWSSFNKD